MASHRPRPAGPHDVALLAELHRQCLGESGGDIWDRQAIATVLNSPGVFAYMALADDETPAGLVIARAAGGESEILTMAVLPAVRRRGLGSALIDAALSHAAEMGIGAVFLEVAADNGAAQALYRRGGFRPVGRRAGYYRRRSGRIDAIILRRDLGLPVRKRPSGDTDPG